MQIESKMRRRLMRVDATTSGQTNHKSRRRWAMSFSNAMSLDEVQRKKVAGWIAEGLKLSEIQNRITAELGVRLTYMDVRLLVDDLKLMPKDVELPKPAPASALTQPASPDAGKAASPSASPETRAPGKDLSLSVDQIARPGSVVSGKVTFSDGNKAEWYFDQSGRLGLVSQQPGYRPSAVEVQRFQLLLESELSKLGF